MKYTALSRGFFTVLASLLILLLETRFLAIYIYMEYPVFLWELFWGGFLARPKGKN